MSLKEAIHDINHLIQNGGLYDAIDKYHHPEVRIYEKDQLVAGNRDENVAREKEFLAGVTEWREARILDVAVGEHTTMTEWHLDFVHETYGHKKGNQVALQEWRDGKVIREQFYSLY